MIGVPLRRVEDARLLAGRGRYVGDIVLPRMVHVAFVRSVHAHARVRGVNRTRTLAAPGVVDCVVARERFTFHRHAGVALENRACLADFSPAAGLTLWSSTQIPGIVRDALAEILDLPIPRVRVIAPDVGGGFGLKTVLYPEEIV